MEVLVFAKENMISILGSMKRFSLTILTHIYGQYITALAVYARFKEQVVD